MTDADAPTTEQTPPDEGASAPSPADSLYETPETELEAGTESEAEAERAAAEAPESDEETISSINDWITELSGDPERAALLKVPVKINGEAATATLSDLVKSYQIGEAAERRLDEAKAKAKSLTDDLQQQQQSVQAQLTVAAKLIEHAESLVDADAAAIDWNTLRQDDPAEYSAKKEEIRERRAGIDRLKTEAMRSYQEAVSAAETKQAETLQETRATERAALLQAMPELEDEKAFQAFGQQILRYATGLGFTADDVGSVLDHRILVLADKARRWDELQAGKDKLKEKKQVKPPKVMKPGARTDTQPKPADRSPEEILYG